jgi:hypothetical protein
MLNIFSYLITHFPAILEDTEKSEVILDCCYFDGINCLRVLLSKSRNVILSGGLLDTCISRCVNHTSPNVLNLILEHSERLEYFVRLLTQSLERALFETTNKHLLDDYLFIELSWLYANERCPDYFHRLPDPIGVVWVLLKYGARWPMQVTEGTVNKFLLTQLLQIMQNEKGNY